MKESIRYFLGADIIGMMTYFYLQISTGDFVIDNTAKVFAGIFVGFISGFCGVLGKRAAEDYVKQRKQKKDANKKT